VLLRHYRQPFASYQLEIPAGKLDQQGESELEAAQRELREEAGLMARTWDRLLTFRNSAGWTDESTTIFLATGIDLSSPPADFEATDEEADLEVVRMPANDRVVRLLITGGVGVQELAPRPRFAGPRLANSEADELVRRELCADAIRLTEAVVRRLDAGTERGHDRGRQGDVGTRDQLGRHGHLEPVGECRVQGLHRRLDRHRTRSPAWPVRAVRMPIRSIGSPSG
jgi:ADP-ribose pyrophosphatase YjhB (NUDIX family)